jgi:hypothetical protein
VSSGVLVKSDKGRRLPALDASKVESPEYREVNEVFWGVDKWS